VVDNNNKDDSAAAHIIAVVAGEDVYATIRSSEHRMFYSLKSISGGLHLLVRMEDSLFPLELEPLGVVGEDVNDHNSDNKNSKNKDNNNIEIITAIIAYTPGAAEEVANINALIQLAVDETNEGYLLSNVDLVLNVTRVYQTVYAESGSYSTDLTRFRTKNDGFMDEVHGLRNIDRANMAHLVVSSGSSCGVASTILATTTTAFCLTAQDCATGYYTFGHEMGHLQGTRHNPEQDRSLQPFVYGHGHIIQSRMYRSIMAYDEDGETRVLRWSNPDVTYNGFTTGETECCDNARVLDETASTVQSWCATGSCA